MHAGTRNDQIARACQACKSLRLCSELQPQPRYLCQASGHQCSLCIVTESHAVGYPRAERYDILQRSAELDAYDVFCRVDSESVCHEKILHFFSRLDIMRCCRYSCRQSPAYFLGMRRPRQHDVSVHVDMICRYLRHPEQSFLFYSFSYIYDQRIVFDMSES